MPTRTEWRDAEIMRAVRARAVERMEKSVIVVKDNVKVLINRGNADGKNPSAPGEPPKKVSGLLQRKITAKVVTDEKGDIEGWIGSDVPYEPRLELGFVGTDSAGRRYHQAPRPGFRLGAERSIAMLKRIWGMR